MKKRVLSLFMAFTLCFSMQPTVAFAGGTGVVTEQEAPSGENTTEVFTADSISGGDVSGGDAGVQDTEKDATLQAVQALINALPDEVTAENADELQAQLIAIDKALTELSEEQIAQLDMARCESICAALTSFTAPATAFSSRSCRAFRAPVFRLPSTARKTEWMKAISTQLRLTAPSFCSPAAPIPGSCFCAGCGRHASSAATLPSAPSARRARWSGMGSSSMSLHRIAR